MLPTYPKLENYRSRLNHDRIRAKVRAIAPMFGMIRSHYQFEGRGSAIRREDGEVDETPVTAMSGKIKVDLTELNRFSERVLDVYLDDIAEQIAQQMSMQFHERMHEVTEKVGNVVDEKGRPFDERLFLDAMDKMEHSFAPDGTWLPPTIIAGPELAEAIETAGDLSPAGVERLQKILEKKRDAHRRREAARVLVG